MIERDPEYCKYGEKRLADTVFEDSAIARADYDKKPLKVTMPEMIEAGYFIENEDFYFRTGDAVAKLLKNGKLKYEDQILDMHSCAAIARGVKANRLNGFDYWYVIRDEKKVSIADVREQYRESKKQG